jgi:glutaminyl-peptide cyclotransferase
LNTIEHLILLDLLGAPNPTISSFFPDTGWLFDAMVAAESRIAESGLIDSGGLQSFTSFFTQRTGYESGVGFIEDDHVPFLRHGVPILHVIANPFPRVWHTLKVCFSRRPYDLWV